MREIRSGRVLLNGADITNLSVARHRALGISCVPADRRHVGSVTEMSIADNAILGLQQKYSSGVFRNIRQARESAQNLVSRFAVRPTNMTRPLENSPAAIFRSSSWDAKSCALRLR